MFNFISRNSKCTSAFMTEFVCIVGDVNFPTKHFPLLELKNPPNFIFELP